MLLSRENSSINMTHLSSNREQGSSDSLWRVLQTIVTLKCILQLRPLPLQVDHFVDLSGAISNVAVSTYNEAECLERCRGVLRINSQD